MPNRKGYGKTGTAKDKPKPKGKRTSKNTGVKKAGKKK
jgi:hypothetical protein